MKRFLFDGYKDNQNLKEDYYDDLSNIMNLH